MSRSSAQSAGHRRTKIRYALVGLGHIAQVAVLPGFRQAKNSELVAVVSGDPKKLKAVQAKYRVPFVYGYDDWSACLANDEIDAVYLALPNDLHLPYVLSAAKAGKHILCEKPLALNVAEARRMLRATAHHGVRLMTAYRLHFEPATLAALRRVRSGQLGDPRYFVSSFSYQLTDEENIRLSARRGGGPVYDIGTYCINAARHFMQAEPIEVSALFGRPDRARFAQVEETAAVLLRFPGGGLATFVVSFGADTASRFEFVGTKGRLVFEPAYDYSIPLAQRLTLQGRTTEKTFRRTDQFGGEIEAFSQCLLEGREPEPSGEEGLADLRVIDAIFASVKRGRPVSLPAFSRQARPKPAQAKRKPAIPKPPTVRTASPHD